MRPDRQSLGAAGAFAPRPLHGQTTALEDRDALAQAVVDLRRAFDILLARPGVDPKRVAYIGHSFGAQFGAILTAIDRRMATSILIAGVPSEGALWFDSDDPAEVELRRTAGVEALRKLLSVTGVFDGIHFVPYASPIPLLFQFARYDHFPVADMQSYADAVSEPKRVLWCPAGHEWNDPQAIVDRARWLEERIGLKGAIRAVSASTR